MTIKQITLKNFKNFAKITQNMNNMVLFKGKNGSGKSTLALQSILFAFYGYSMSETLKDLPKRNKAKSCSVDIEVLYQNKTYIIHREYPTKLSIQEDGIEMPFNTTTEAQKWIDKTFGNRNDFQKFRIVDAYSSDANFLEEGQTTFKKIIFAGSEELFINLRRKLFQVKKNREIYNKDTAVVYKHYPSDIRLKIIKEALDKLQIKERKLRSKVNSSETAIRKIEREVGQCQERLKTLTYQKTKLMEKKVCYTCKQDIKIEKQKELLGNIEIKIQKINDDIKTVAKDKESLEDLLKFEQKKLDKVAPRTSKLKELKIKLETRIKQKDYKYTNQDVLVAKKAIEEVDRLSTYYLTESIKILEPLINDVLSKIDFKVKFIIDEKDRFKIRLYREDIEYKYADLSTGQKLILQIGFKLALLMEQGKSGIIVADEGLGSLDNDNLSHIIQLFQGLPFQLFLVLHRFDGDVEGLQIIDLNKKDE